MKNAPLDYTRVEHFDALIQNDLNKHLQDSV